MNVTVEHIVIAVVALALIYTIVQHRNLLTDLFRIPDRGHPELKVVKDKHKSDCFWFNPIGCAIEKIGHTIGS